VTELGARTRDAADQFADAGAPQLLALERLRDKLGARTVALVGGNGQILLESGGDTRQLSSLDRRHRSNVGAQRTDDGRQRRWAHAERGAVADEDARPVGRRTELVEEPGLADAGFPGNENRGSRTSARLLQCARKCSRLFAAADELQARDHAHLATTVRARYRAVVPAKDEAVAQ